MSMCGQGIPHDMEVYPGAKHAFFNDQWRAAAFPQWGQVTLYHLLTHTGGCATGLTLTSVGGHARGHRSSQLL